MSTPYLIQRLNFRQPARTEKGGFDDVISCDYMGSAEFEFGALPKSLKKISRLFDSLQAIVFKRLENHKGSELYIIAMPVDAIAYFDEHIDGLAKGKTRLKEQSRFKEAVSGYDFMGRQIKENSFICCDAWWDLHNDIIFTFGKKNAQKILKAIENTRDKKKSEGVEGWY